MSSVETKPAEQLHFGGTKEKTTPVDMAMFKG